MNLTIELPDEQNAALAAKAREQGLSAVSMQGKCYRMRSKRLDRSGGTSRR